MSEVRGVVVAHGSLARCLVETAESISGVSGALKPISNVGCSPGLLESRIRSAIDEHPAIIFVDIASGSCSHAARIVGRAGRGIPVVSGVNLPMLLDFVFHRDMEPLELAGRLVERGRAGAIAYVPDPSS